MISLMNQILCVLIFMNLFYSPNESVKQMSFSITKTWDNQLIPANAKIDFHMEFKNNNKRELKDLVIKVWAPFYNDPPIPANTSEGSMDKLWDYEVAEVFLLGSDDHYLEIELGPKGQYLLLQLHGYRNVTKYPLFIDYYKATIEDNRWTGEAHIPGIYLPPDLHKFNAYAIHGTDPKRQYLSLFPTPHGKYEDPDFHKLEYFENFPLN